mgnify:CR=1 FL=1
MGHGTHTIKEVNTMKVSIVPNWVLPFGYGLTLYKWVLVKRSPYLAQNIAHEAEHVRQWVEHGFFPFIIAYAANHIKYGYWNNPFEVQARARAIPDAYLYTEYL